MMLNPRPRRLGYRKKKRGGPKLVFVQYGFCRESKRHYEQSRAGTRIYIGYALSWSHGGSFNWNAPAPAWLMAAVTLTAVVSPLSLIG